MRLLAPSRGTHTYWADKDPVIFEGVIGLTKDRLFPGSLEYFIGDGTHRYSELPKYGGAEASSTKKSNTLVLRDANGLIDSDSIPASITTKPNNVVKADGDGSLSGWKSAIINAIIANNASGGLATDENGNMIVDFDQMPTNKFEALLKSLKMQIPLEADLNLYVDKNHSAAGDTIIDGRGTASKPFKTIQACINYATLTYAVGRYNIYIYIAQATYNEGLTLPTFTRTSGTITLRAADDNAPPTITNPGPVTSLASATGGYWTLRRLNLSASWSDPNTGTNQYPTVIGASQGAILTVYGCALSAEYVGAAPANRVRMAVVYATGNGSVSLGVMAGYHNSLSCTIGNANNACMILAERNGTIMFPRANIDDDGIAYDTPCSGTVSVFAQATEKCSITTSGGGLHGQEFSGTVTGKKYQCSVLSIIGAPYGGFPGDTAGTVDSTTFSTYAESNRD